MLKKIFSVENKDIHKVVTVAGVKLKFKSKKLIKKNIRKTVESARRMTDYINYVLNQQYDKTNFVEISEGDYNFSEDNVKLISMYLPQYHDFPENVKWFGRGFSEWSNTSKAVPQYVGHWQPHIPIDVGYYNLNDNTTLKRQIELAKKYGIYGFAFYYYWFSGEKLMEKPLQRFLDDKSLDMPFFLFWANENWTRLWGDGNEKEVLHVQRILADDAEKFMEDALPYMRDSRYIKINNCPLLILYRPDIYPFDVYLDFNIKIRDIAKKNGFDDLYILTPTWRAKDYVEDMKNYTDQYRLDGLFEFFPLGLKYSKRKKETIINSLFKGKILDIGKYIEEKKFLYSSSATIFKGVFPNWDNTPRKAGRDFGCFIYQLSPQLYKMWLKEVIKWTKLNRSKEEQFVFINAWNEWAEGGSLRT